MKFSKVHKSKLKNLRERLVFSCVFAFFFLLCLFIEYSVI